MSEWLCPDCRHMIDTPMHELGCSANVVPAAQKPINTRRNTISTDLTTLGGADIEALLEQQEEEFGDIKVTVPLLKVGQDLTAEVKRGDAERGDFINSMTGESYGTEIGFIPCYFQLGRFAALKDGRAFVAFGKNPVIPDAWEPVVGPEWIGQPFSEHPESEERFKADVNSGDRQWGSGPEISTTHNFTGYAIVASEDAGDEDVLVPVRWAAKRTDVPAANKLHSLRKMLRLRAMWDYTFDLSTKVKTSGRHESYIVQVKAGRPTTDEEKLIAVQLARESAAGTVQEAGTDAPAPAAEPNTPDGALGV